MFPHFPDKELGTEWEVWRGKGSWMAESGSEEEDSWGTLSWCWIAQRTPVQAAPEPPGATQWVVSVSRVPGALCCPRGSESQFLARTGRGTVWE